MSRPTPKILVVAGETGLADELRDKLRKRGYVVTDVVSSGEEALKSFRDTPPDLVLLHVDLKGPADGLETAHRLRREEPVPVIILAARADTAAVERAKTMKVEGILTLPVDDEQLSPAVEIALAEKLAREDGREQEEQFHVLFRYHEAVMLLVEPSSGRIVDANCAAESFYGYPREQLQSMNIREINALPSEEVLSALTRALRREQATFVFPHRTAAGSVRKVEVHSSPIHYRDRSLLLSIIYDVTERRLAEEQVREMNSFMASMMESSSSISIISTDLEGVIEYWNAGATRLFGYTPGEMVGRQSIALLYPRDDRETMKAITEIREAAIGQRQSIRREVRQVTKDGRTLWVNLTVSPRVDAAGDVVGLLGIGEDITERKAIEDVLARQTTLYETIFQVQSDIGEGFILVQGNRILYANDAFALLSGYSIGELLALPSPAGLVAPEDRGFAERWSRIRGRKRPEDDRFEGVLLRKDGRRVDVEGALRPIGQGSPDQVIGIFRDITDRKQTERELRLLGQTVASTKDCFSITDMNDTILFVNEAFCRTYGYSEEELIGKPISIVLSPQAPPDIVQTIRPATIAGGWNGEILDCRKDGSLLPIELWTSVVKNDKGEPVALVGVARDITERKRAERLQQAVLRIAELALTGKGLVDVLRSIHEEIETLVPARNLSIALYDRSGDLISFPYFVDEIEATPPPHKPGRGLTELVLRTGRPLLASSEEIARLVSAGDVDAMASLPVDWLGVPLVVEGECIGVLALQSRTPKVRFSGKEREVLTFVSTQVAMTIRQKRVEEMITNSERKFRAVFEHANDAILLMNGMELFDCNPRAEQMFDLPRTQLVGHSFSSLFPPDGPAGGISTTRLEGMLARILSGAVESFECQLCRGDGTIFDAEASLNPVNLDGRIIVQSMIRDVTERKRNERVVQESELRLRRITENMMDMITQIDLRGTIQYVSPSVKDILGYDPQDFIGRNALEFIDPQDAAAVSARASTVAGSSPGGRLEYRLKHARGHYLWIESTINPMYEEDGTISGYTIGSRDISHRKDVEELMKRDESRLETLLKLNDMDNASARQLAEMALEAGIRLTESTMGFLAFVDEEERVLSMHVWSKNPNPVPSAVDAPPPIPIDRSGMLGEPIRQRRPIITNVPPLPGSSPFTPAGHVPVYRHLGVPVFDGHKIVALVGVANKPVDYHQADVRQLTLLVEGVWMILQRRRAEELIRNSLSEKEVLLKEIHHRVKNNLQIISSLLNLQSDRVKEPGSLEIFRDSQNRIRSMALVHEKLYRSRDLAAIDFSQYIQSLTAYLWRSYAGEEHTVALKLDTGDVSLGVDVAIPCGLIINELVSNSLKHAFPGMKGGEIGVSLRQEGETCTLVVGDNGVGFPPGVEFWNSESLGLQLVHTLAKQLGASMELGSEGGTTFTLRFPVKGER